MLPKSEIASLTASSPTPERRGGRGVPPRSPPPCSRFAGREGRGGSRRPGGTGPALPTAVNFSLGSGAGVGRAAGRPPVPHRLPGGLRSVGSAGETPVSLGWEREGGSPPGSGGFLPRGRGERLCRPAVRG